MALSQMYSQSSLFSDSIFANLPTNLYPQPQPLYIVYKFICRCVHIITKLESFLAKVTQNYVSPSCFGSQI